MACTKVWTGFPALCPLSAELTGEGRGSLFEIVRACPCVVDAFQVEFVLCPFLVDGHILVKRGV